MKLVILGLLLCLVLIYVEAGRKGKSKHHSKGIAGKGHHLKLLKKHRSPEKKPNEFLPKASHVKKAQSTKIDRKKKNSKARHLKKKRSKEHKPKKHHSKEHHSKENDSKARHSKERVLEKHLIKKPKSKKWASKKQSSKEHQSKKLYMKIPSSKKHTSKERYSKKPHSKEKHHKKPHSKEKHHKKRHSKEKHHKKPHSKHGHSKESHHHSKESHHHSKEKSSKEHQPKRPLPKEIKIKKQPPKEQKSLHCVFMKCSSLKNRRQRCGNRGLVAIGDITSMTVVKQMSKKKCNRKKSYGFKRKSIWVNKGCSAVFKVCIGKGNTPKGIEAGDAPKPLKTLKKKITRREYVACYKDSRKRLLTMAIFRSSKMTVELCSMLCTRKKTRFFGVEHGVECFCGNDIKRHGRANERECKTPCRGNKKQKCGGTWRVSVYKVSPKGKTPKGIEADDAPKPLKTLTKKITRREYVACYKDSRKRLLTKAIFRSSKMTVELCSMLCAKKRTRFAGVEHGVECFCGNDIRRHGRANERECKTPCRGNKKQKCGGTWRVSVYKVSPKALRPKCHKRAKLRRDKCVCRRGYYGDGVNACDKTCTCMASGDPHYKTYDGQMIHFMGTCKYTLTKTTKDYGDCSFSVEVKNERRGKNTRVAYTRTVDLNMYGKKVRLSKGGKVSINGQKKFLPVEENNKKLKIFRSGRFVQIWTECGVEVNFDGVHSVFVVTPAKYKGHLKGLCGDCNGKKDDFKTKNGKDVSKKKNKFALIGDSYSVTDDSDDPATRCETEDVPTECEPRMNNLVNEADVCGDLNSVKGRFAACVKAIPLTARDYYRSCVMDMCSYQGEVKLLHKVKCSSLESFVEECADYGIEMKWRTDKFCPLKCEDPNMIYMVSGTGCPATCTDPTAPSKCTIEAREGCFCKPGFVLSDDKCIKQEECGCKDSNGDYFPIGSKKGSNDCSKEYLCKKLKRGTRFVVVSTGKRCHRNAVCTYDPDGVRSCVCKTGHVGDGYKVCKPLCGLKYQCHKHARCVNNQCVCKHGLYGDGINSCDKKCTCTASGDPHYKTYDGQMIHFMGDCKYTLTKSIKDIGNCTFNVEVQNERRNGNNKVSFTRYVEVHLGKVHIRLDQDRKLFVNEQQKYLPFTSKDKKWNAYSSGSYLKLKTDCDVMLSWNGKSVVQVVIPQKYGDAVTGICGNCNGRQDDYRTRKGLDVSNKRNKYSLVGNSYEVTGDKDGIDRKSNKKCKTQDDLPKCSEETTKVILRDDYCGMLRSGNPKSPFKDCINAMTTTSKEYLESCTEDACAYSDNLVKSKNVVCMTLGAFAEECLTNGYKVKWRTSTFCPIKCNKNMKYSEAVTGCPATCADPQAPNKCKEEPTEGCECLPGYVLSGTECVPQNQCGCQRDGEYYPLNTKLVSSDCTSVEQCIPMNGESIFLKIGINIKCHSNGRCGLQDGYRKCVCADGYVGDGIKKCTKVSTPTPKPKTSTNKPTPSPKPKTSTNKPTPSPKPATTTNKPTPSEPQTTPDEVNDEPTTVNIGEQIITTTPKPPSCNHPEPECSVNVRHHSCGTETMVTGNCVYSNQFSSQCQYMVTTGVNNDGEFVADVTIGGKKTRLGSGRTLKDCASFSMKGSLFVITEDTCERCILQFIRNMVPNNTCQK